MGHLEESQVLQNPADCAMVQTVAKTSPRGATLLSLSGDEACLCDLANGMKAEVMAAPRPVLALKVSHTCYSVPFPFSLS